MTPAPSEKDTTGPVPPSSGEVSKLLFKEIMLMIVPLAKAFAEVEHDSYAAAGGTEAKVQTSDDPDDRMIAIAVDQKRKELRSALIEAAKDIGEARNKLQDAMIRLQAKLPRPPKLDKDGRPIQVTDTGPYQKKVNEGAYDQRWPERYRPEQTRTWGPEEARYRARSER